MIFSTFYKNTKYLQFCAIIFGFSVFFTIFIAFGANLMYHTRINNFGRQGMKPASDGKQKWINCIILALLMFIGLGFCSSNKSLYLSAITDALGIKRSVFWGKTI